MKEFFILFLGIGVLLMTTNIQCNPVDADKVSDLTEQAKEVNDAIKETEVNSDIGDREKRDADDYDDDYSDDDYDDDEYLERKKRDVSAFDDEDEDDYDDYDDDEDYLVRRRRATDYYDDEEDDDADEEYDDDDLYLVRRKRDLYDDDDDTFEDDDEDYDDADYELERRKRDLYDDYDDEVFDDDDEDDERKKRDIDSGLSEELASLLVAPPVNDESDYDDDKGYDDDDEDEDEDEDEDDDDDDDDRKKRAIDGTAEQLESNDKYNHKIRRQSPEGHLSVTLPTRDIYIDTDSTGARKNMLEINADENVKYDILETEGGNQAKTVVADVPDSHIVISRRLNTDGVAFKHLGGKPVGPIAEKEKIWEKYKHRFTKDPEDAGALTETAQLG